MRILRYSSKGRAKYGVLDGNTIKGLRGSPFAKFRGSDSLFVIDDSSHHLNEVKLLAPCTPSKIVCLGLNYRRHAEETNLPIPEVPLIFLKPSTAVIGPDDEIVIPPESRRVDYEAELGVVIGKRAKSVDEGDIADYIFGYTCFNDVSERYNQRDDVQWTRAKGYDTFAPLGPWIETEISPGDLKIETYLNGELRQTARTSDLIFSVPKIVSFISGIMTLLPGDVIATGTPSGIGRMNAGDTVEISIENIGILRNTVANVH